MNGVKPTTSGIKPAQNGLGDGVSQKHRLIESVFSKETMDQHVFAAPQSEDEEFKNNFLARAVGETEPKELDKTLNACAGSRGLTAKDISDATKQAPEDDGFEIMDLSDAFSPVSESQRKAPFDNFPDCDKDDQELKALEKSFTEQRIQSVFQRTQELKKLAESKDFMG